MDKKDISNINNSDLPSMEFKNNINLDKLIEYFKEASPDELRETLKEYGVKFTNEDK